METVKHKIFGAGEVIKKEGNYLTVRFFNDGSERRFVIPNSFQLGILTAEGSLKNEVNNAIMEFSQKTTEAPIINAQSRSSFVSSNQFKKRISKAEITGETATAFGAYLIKAGYKAETDDGKPSTVYAYIKAIDLVLDEEHLSWESLRFKITDIVRLYDSGGKKEYLGNKSNKTVINALKRFNEFVDAL